MPSVCISRHRHGREQYDATKEPYIFLKEPYIPSKEPKILHKEPISTQISNKRNVTGQVLAEYANPFAFHDIAMVESSITPQKSPTSS